MNDEVVEVGLQPLRHPSLFGSPSARSVCHGETTRPDSSAVASSADEDGTVRDLGRLYHGSAWPRVLPQQRAVGRSKAGGAGATHQQDLSNSVDR